VLRLVIALARRNGAQRHALQLSSKDFLFAA
jgi:hypothetical protein